MSKKNQIKDLGRLYNEIERNGNKYNEQFKAASDPVAMGRLIFESARGDRFKVKKKNIKKYLDVKNNEKKMAKFLGKYRYIVCPHAAITSKGKTVRIMTRTNGGKVRCPFCEAMFNPKPETQDELRAKVNDLISTLQRCKFICFMVGDKALPLMPIFAQMIRLLTKMYDVSSQVNIYSAKQLEAKKYNGGRKDKRNRFRNNSGYSFEVK